ncbi:hypothetical protein Rs2_01187 [Raphanus sativus]|nr:hypothetical protein Rs2_32573 [Raphanus sativus]KAJ4915637.1 hypothetical protein Rs2_01187 [Raphanus sativus]
MWSREKVSSSFSVSQTSFFRDGVFMGTEVNSNIKIETFCLLLIREGFVSLDCRGTEPFTDEHGLNWTPDDHLLYGSMYLTGVEDKFHLSVAALYALFLLTMNKCRRLMSHVL